MSLAIFDLDNTLLGGDSDHLWGQFLVSQGIVSATAYTQANDMFYQQYQQGTLDINAYLEFALSPLANHPKAQLDIWHQQFMKDIVEPIILPKAIELLKKHRDQGDFLLIITATNQFVTEPIAKALGVDHILATIAQLKDGAYTGKAEGIPCFQEGKVERLQLWLQETGHTLEDCYFYSDSCNDLPLLNTVPFPIAVDPDQHLNEYATDKGWPIISLRESHS